MCRVPAVSRLPQPSEPRWRHAASRTEPFGRRPVEGLARPLISRSVRGLATIEIASRSDEVFEPTARPRYALHHPCGHVQPHRLQLVLLMTAISLNQRRKRVKTLRPSFIGEPPRISGRFGRIENQPIPHSSTFQYWRKFSRDFIPFRMKMSHRRATIMRAARHANRSRL